MTLPLSPTNPRLPAPAAMRSMLLLECGAAWTQATLLGVAEGHCRLLACDRVPTTLEDVGLGLRQAMQGISGITGRRLVAQQRVIAPETPTGDGVDGVALMFSAGGPLRVQISGPGQDHWLPTVQRALASLAHTISTSPGEAIDALLLLGPAPDAPMDDAQGAEWESAAALAAEQARATAQVQPDHPGPVIVVLGSATAQGMIKDMLAGLAVQLVETGGSVSASRIALTLARIYEDRVLRQVAGSLAPRDWSALAPMSAVQALSRFARFVAQRYATHALVVAIGADETVALGASPQGRLFVSQAHGMGSRQGAGALLRQAGGEAIQQWLSAPLAPEELDNAVLARMLTPQLLPETRAELEMDLALGRGALRLLLAQSQPAGGVGDLPRTDVLIGTGALLATIPTLAEAALVLLDGVQPRGICQLVLDVANIATALGAASLLDSVAAADAVDVDALLMQLGTCVSTVGTPPAQQPAVRAVLEYADGHRHVTDVLPGTIESLPLAVGQRARLMLYPAPGVDVGLGPGERAFAGEPVEGGRLGLIVDARGRPLVLPDDPQQRQAQVRQWHAALGTLRTGGMR